jgi:hypothetical protein
MGKIVDRACNLGGAALSTLLSLLLWCSALLLGLVLVISFIALVLSLVAMSCGLATAELSEDCE